jgi:tetratricopeptide (TPR) repeat protein
VLSSEPAAHRLLGPEETGLGLGGRRLSPFVGRDSELGLLVERLRQVRSTGHGHVIQLMGEPGAGKSRLLLEFRRGLGAEQTVVLEGRCVSYAATSPYAAVADVLRRAWALDTADGPTVAVDCVDTALRRLTLDLKALGPYLLAVLAIETAPALAVLSPEALRERTFDALRQVLQAHARTSPLVLLLEDLHWMDRTSDAFLGTFVETLPGVACLAIITTRPGHPVPWLGRSWTSQLALPPLAIADGRRIAGAILAPDTDATVVEQIARRGEGNPFFLEELACAVSGQHATHGAVSVPATVAAALEARIDRLPAHARVILQAAAVIGRDVPLELLAALTDRSTDQLLTDLQHLIASEFVYEQPGPVHVFKHALTQEVAYARLPEDERRRLHATVGTALETQHLGRLDEHLDQLAYHFDRSNDHAKAVGYLSRLARRMEANYVLDEAIDTVERAIKHCGQLPRQEGDRRVLSLVSDMAVPFALLGRAAELETRLLPYQAHVDRDDDPSLAAKFYLARGIACDFTGRFRDAENLEREALRYAERAGDRRTLGQVLVLMAQSSLWTCAYRDGADRAERSRAFLDEQTGSLWHGMAAWFTTLHAALLGQLDRALEAARQTEALAVRLGDRRMESYGRCLAAWVTGRKGNAKQALALCLPTLDMAPDANARMVIRCFLGQLAVAADEVALARKELREGFESCRATGFGPFAVWNLAWLAVAEVAAGDATAALRLADEARTMADQIDFALGRGLASRGRGLALSALGDMQEAVASLTIALETFQSIETAYEAALCQLDLARILGAAGMRDAAVSYLKVGLSALEAIGVPVDAVGARSVARTLGVEIVQAQSILRE